MTEKHQKFNWRTKKTRLTCLLFFLVFFSSRLISNMVVLQVLKDFARATSIHGLGFVVDSRLSIFKRVAWALIFTAAIMWASIQLHFAVTCKLRIKFLKISNQFVASEPPKVCDLRNSWFTKFVIYEILFILFFAWSKKGKLLQTVSSTIYKTL